MPKFEQCDQTYSQIKTVNPSGNSQIITDNINDNVIRKNLKTLQRA